MPEHIIEMTLFLAEAIDPEQLIAEVAPCVPETLTFRQGHQGRHAWATWMRITIADDTAFASFDPVAVWRAVQERFPGTAIDFLCLEWRAGVYIDANGEPSLEDHNLGEQPARRLENMRDSGADDSFSSRPPPKLSPDPSNNGRHDV